MEKRLAALALSVLLVGCATTTSPTGRTQYVGAVSRDQLNQMGALAFAETRSKLRASGDARQQAYVRCIVSDIVHELPAEWQQLAWESEVFVDDEPNAFALPGGKVGVHTGIFRVAQNQAQLAAVVAHEIGHVYANHHDERITRQKGAQSFLTLTTLLLGARYGEAAQQSTGQLGSAVLQTGFLLPGTRKQETEADVVGQDLMARAGFDPREAVNLWQNMITASRSARPPQWLSTHPNPENRISELQGRAQSLMPVYEQALRSGKHPDCG